VLKIKEKGGRRGGGGKIGPGERNLFYHLGISGEERRVRRGNAEGGKDKEIERFLQIKTGDLHKRATSVMRG